MANSSDLRFPRRMLLFVFILLAMAAGHAQSFDVSHLAKPANLDAPWRISVADNPAFARPDFDDSAWPLFDPRTSLQNALRGQHPPVLWYRLRLTVDPAAHGLALREYNLAHAYEIYANGERLLGSGSVVPYRGATLGARRVVAIPDRLLGSGTVLLAVRVGIPASEWLSENPGLYYFNLTVGQRETLRHEA
jgi:phosphoserine phosphatase RsbU/P